QSRTLARALVAGLSWMGAAACGSDGAGPAEPDPATAGTGTGGAPAAVAGGPGTGGVGGMPSPGSSGGTGPIVNIGGGPGTSGESCTGETTTAKLVPLDLYLMLDSSGSMLETTEDGAGSADKWT